MSLIPPTKEWWLKLETMCYPRFDISIGKWRYHTERINGPVKIGFCHLAVEGDPQSKSKFLISENGYIYHYDTFFNKGTWRGVGDQWRDPMFCPDFKSEKSNNIGARIIGDYYHSNKIRWRGRPFNAPWPGIYDFYKEAPSDWHHAVWINTGDGTGWTKHIEKMKND